MPVTQFGQMCQRLGIDIIAANSPQAKGRVERNHGTHQDRLVKKMRLKKIKTHAEANTFLEKEYLPEHNRRFRRIPAQPEDYHRRAPRAAELEEVFHLETGESSAMTVRGPRAKSRCASGRTGAYRFAIAIGRCFGRRFEVRFQFRQ